MQGLRLVVVSAAPVCALSWLAPHALDAAGELALLGTSATARSATGPDAVSAAIVAVVTIAATVTAAWATATLALAVLARLAGLRGRALVRLSPPGWRTVVATVVGCSTLAIGPATAAPVSGPEAPHAGRGGHDTPSEVLSGLRLPDRPASPTRTRPADPVHVVRNGESLWTIAESELTEAGRAHGPAAIDTRWRSWYRANRAVIGDDPGLVLPGTRLHTPTTRPIDHTEGDHR